MMNWDGMVVNLEGVGELAVRAPLLFTSDLQALLPDCHIEAIDGELVIYTGWAEADDGSLIEWSPT